jgi:predicted SAM-dependent methyltransferase
MKKENKLHLGCGSYTPEDWINLDGSWNAWLAKHPFIKKILALLHIVPKKQLNIKWNPNIVIHDVKKPLPFPDASMDAVYSSHLLEHLCLEEAKKLLKECYRVLKPNGVLRIVVPDLKSIVTKYLEDINSNSTAIRECAADKLCERLNSWKPKLSKDNIFYKIYKWTKSYNFHKWQYDAYSLQKYFVDAGFRAVEEKEIYESRISGIEKIEREGRVLNGVGICVEGIK